MKHLILGAVLLVLGFWGMQVWWSSFSFVIRALLPLALLAVGVTALLSSYFRAFARDEDEEENGAEEVVAARGNAEVKAEAEAAAGSAEPEPQES